MGCDSQTRVACVKMINRKRIHGRVASESKGVGWLMLGLLGAGASFLTMDSPGLPFLTRAALWITGVGCIGLAFLFGWAKWKRLMADGHASSTLSSVPERGKERKGG